MAGIREKILAALRGGVHTVALPAGNRPEAETLEADIRAQLKIVLAAEADELVDVVLEAKGERPQSSGQWVAKTNRAPLR